MNESPAERTQSGPETTLFGDDGRVPTPDQ